MRPPVSDDGDFVPAAGRAYRKRGRPKKRPIGRPPGPNFPDGITAPAGYCPANLELSRLLKDGTSSDVGPRSARPRRTLDLYADPGAQTRLESSSRQDDCGRQEDVVETLVALAQDVLQEHAHAPESEHDKHPAQQRLLKMRNCESHANRKAVAAQKREGKVKHAVELANDIFLRKSWLDRKEDAFLAYAACLYDGGNMGDAYAAAAKAARVAVRTCATWCPDHIENNGEFPTSAWGCNVKNPSAFEYTEIKLEAAKWWRNHVPKKGEPNARICDFREHMLGTQVFKDVLEEINKENYTEEMFRQFTISLGFTHQDLRKGTFNDEHESDANQKDRRNRFLPEYFNYYEHSPHIYHGHDTDTLDDIDVRNRFFVTVTGTDGRTRKINLGGELPPGDGPVYMIGSHDESCFKAGQYQTRAWVHGSRQTCMDKTDGPSLHYACFSVEYGNGCICLDPESPPPTPITLKELKGWHDKWSAGITVDLPATADVSMEPGSGKGKDGWWRSPEFWMQIDLACVIFRTVFGPPDESRFRLVAHIDWSQGHAAMDHHAHNAERMLVGTGGKTATHINHTSWPYSVNGRGHSLPRQLLCTPGCKECTEMFKKHGDPNSPNFDPDFQSIGFKGLELVLQERGMMHSGLKNQGDMVAALQTCSDFKPRDSIGRAAVTAQMQRYNYVALFGVKYHAELAHIERKWMKLKRLVRPKLDGSLPVLRRLLKDVFPQYTVGDARKAARHCRDSMRAYYSMGAADLDQLREEELKMKGHRRVFDSVTGRFVSSAGLQQTAHQKKMALRTERRRLHDVAKAAHDERKNKDWKSFLKREANASASDKVKLEWKERSKKRKATFILKQFKNGDDINIKKVKWANNVLKES